MEIKTKIFKILPVWLGAMALIVSAQLAASLLDYSRPNELVKADLKPQVLGASTSLRGEPQSPQAAIEKTKEPSVSAVTAKSFLVFELENGRNLLEKDPKEKLGIASLTKLMTALVAYKKSDLNQSFLVSTKDTSSVSPVLGLAAGDKVNALDVFNAMLVGSSNDAALALSNYTAISSGENFVALMNEQAKILGMGNSHFSNAIGFDSQYNYSTAEDLKLLISQTQKLAAFTNLGRRQSYEFFGSQNNRYFAAATNKLIEKYPDISAIKTGFTIYSKGAMASKVKVGNYDVVILVLGSEDREGDTLKLKNEVENSFRLD